MDRRDLVSGIFWFAVSIILIFKAFELQVGAFSNPKPGFLLFWSSLSLAILSIILVVKSYFKKGRKTTLSEPWKGLKWVNAVGTIALLFLYASFLKSLGFLLAMFFFLLPLYYIGKVKLHISMAAAAVTVVVTYVLFHFALRVPFPQGVISW